MDGVPLSELEAKLTVYDDTLAQPTMLVDQVLVFLDDNGAAEATSVEDVLVLPTTAPKTTITTVTGTKTTTVTVGADGTGTPEPIFPGVIPLGFGPGPVVPPSGLPPVSEPVPTSGVGNSSSSSDLKFSGVSYSPYKANQDCKSQADINQDFSEFAHNYGLVRIYGTDCNQVPMVHMAAKNHGLKMFLGVYNINQVPEETHDIISGLNGDWSRVHTISIGNELVNNGQASPSEVINAMSQARSILRAAGYGGPVVAVDTFTAAENHPELCNESDYCAVNAHPFFDPTATAPEAGKWLDGTIKRLQTAMGSSKRVVITETGWPTDGVANGLAVPSLANQKAALASIHAAFRSHPGDLILFSAFNDLWKTKSMATFDTDQYWGIDGAVSKTDMA